MIYFSNYFLRGIIMADFRFISSNAKIPFRCQRCGKCCRGIQDSLMLEPIDVFHLARFLHETDNSISCPDDFLEKYAHASAIEGNYPVYLINTVGDDASCVFLDNENHCTVYGGRPLVCRMFPFGVAPGIKGSDFRFYICEDHSHHFGTGQVIAKNWISDNFSKEARAFIRMETALLADIGKPLARLSAEAYGEKAFLLLYYLYSKYDLDKPFIAQYEQNCTEIRSLFDV